MSNSPPYALVIDCDSEARKCVSAALGEAGFVVVGFAQPRGALAALAARPADLAVIAGHLPDGSDGYAAARQARHCQRGLKVLFTAAAGMRPDAPGGDDGHVVTRPFERRRFLSAVFELLSRDAAEPGDRQAAEMGVIEAELACLASRYAAAARDGGGYRTQDLLYRIRDAMAARQALLPSRDSPGESR